MANRFVDPRAQFIDASGNPYAGGFLYFYETLSTTPADTYSESTLTTENTNPVELDSAGRLPNDVFLDPNITYKVVLKDADGVTIWTADPVDDPAANVTAAIQVYGGNPNGNLAGSAGTQGGSGASVCWDITNNLLYVCTTTGTASTAVWTQVGATLAGGVQMTGIISPTALAADQNNYSPTGNAAASIIRQDLSAQVTITGLAGGAAGFLKTITNISSAYNLVLESESNSSTAANRFALDRRKFVLAPGQSLSLYYDNTSSRWRPRGVTQPSPNMPPCVPGGRLSIESGVPVSTSDQTGKTTVYYEAYIHGRVPVWNGVNWSDIQAFGLSQALSNNTTSPAATTANNVYDLFVWDNGGTPTLSRGPAWSSATSRGTGAGTTELERVQGVYLNKVAITNGPAANRGTYVGTIATDASNQLNMMFAPAAAAGGTANRLDVWNMYNRVNVASLVRDSTDTWDYGTATWRAANNSNNNRVTFVCGLNEDIVDAEYMANVSTNSSRSTYVGVCLDATNTFTGLPGSLNVNNNDPQPISARWAGYPGLGRHFIQETEQGDGGSVISWVGDDGNSAVQSGMIFLARM